MKLTSKILLFILLLTSFTSKVMASTQLQVRVSQFLTYQPQTGGAGGYSYIIVENTTNRVNTPSCATYPLYWAINNSNPDIAKVQASQIMFAMSQGRTIDIYGTGDCNISGAGNPNFFETINYLSVH